MAGNLVTMSACFTLICIAVILSEFSVSCQSDVGNRGRNTYSHICQHDPRCSYTFTMDYSDSSDCSDGECNPETDIGQLLGQLLDMVTQLKGQITQQRDQITQQSNQITNLNDRMTDLSETVQIHANDTAVTRLSDTVTQLGEQITLQSEQLTQQSSQITQQIEQITQQSEKITQQSNKITNLDDRMTNLSETVEIHANDPTVTQLSYQITQQSNQITNLEDLVTHLSAIVQIHVNDTATQVSEQTTQQSDTVTKIDCDGIWVQIGGLNGVYEIQPIGALQPFDVYCEMTESGAWTVIQRRQDGSVNFERNWADYKAGFGNIDGEYWLGNDNIYRLTNQASYKLRIDLEKFDGETVYAEYDSFWIEDENNNYTLHLGEYSGTAGDAMRIGYGSNYLDGQPFTTHDRDNDNDNSPGTNCAAHFHGGWWFDACAGSPLNGIYYPREEVHFPDGIVWHTWNGYNTLKSSTMKIQKTG